MFLVMGHGQDGGKKESVVLRGCMLCCPFEVSEEKLIFLPYRPNWAVNVVEDVCAGCKKSRKSGISYPEC